MDEGQVCRIPSWIGSDCETRLLVQVNARMGGGPVCLMNQLVWGVDLVEEQMLASAGIPSRPYIAKRPDKYVAEYSVNAKHTGIIQSVDFVKVSLALQMVFCV